MLLVRLAAFLETHFVSDLKGSTFSCPCVEPGDDPFGTYFGWEDGWIRPQNTTDGWTV